MLCCGIKPLCGWNCERAGSVCRERCGGQGYLSCNRFGDIIGFAHAAVTAEGDNRVLMQKTAKELLSMAASDPTTQARLKAPLASSRPVRAPPPLQPQRGRRPPALRDTTATWRCNVSHRSPRRGFTKLVRALQTKQPRRCSRHMHRQMQRLGAHGRL